GRAPARAQLPRARAGAVRRRAGGLRRRGAGRAAGPPPAAPRSAARRERGQARQDGPAAAPRRPRARPAGPPACDGAGRRTRHRTRGDRARARARCRRGDGSRSREREPPAHRALRLGRAAAVVPLRADRAAGGARRVIRALVVDDEEPARGELRYLLARHADVEVVGEAAAAGAAVAAVREARPDVVFLDVELPAASGLVAAPVLRDLGRPPAVVFVTAHERYAVEAFAVEAFDYLLK